jgi:hypothetical protein
VEAQHAWLLGDLAAAESRYAELVAAYPESLEGWFHLGDVLYHGNPARARRLVEARLPFERALRLDPEHLGSLMHLARIAAREGRRAEVVSLCDRMLRLSPTADHSFAVRALRAFAGGSAEEQERVLAETGTAKGFALLNAFADAAIAAQNPDGAARLARATIEVALSDPFRALGHLGLACALLALDRRAEARESLQVVERLTPAWALETRAVLASLPGAEVSSAEWAQVRAALTAGPPAGPEPLRTAGPLRLLHQLQDHVRDFLAALVALRLGDRAGAALGAEALGERDVPSGGEAEVEHLLRVLQAELALAGGDPTGALHALERSRRDIWYQVATWSPVLAGTHERLLRARLLFLQGRAQDAETWLETLAQRSPFEFLGLDAARRLR